MEEETITPEVQTDQNEQDYSEDTEVSDDTIQLSADEYNQILEAREKAEKEAARMKKLFANAREHQKVQKQEPITNNQTNTLSRDEAILFAKGLSEDDVVYASKIAQVEGIRLADAIENPLYKAYVKNKEEVAKSEKAQVSVSRRGHSYEPPKTFDTVQSREEHMELWKKSQGR